MTALRNGSLTLLAATFVLGCNQDYELKDDASSINPLDNQPDPCIEVTPSTVEFDSIRVLEDPPQTEVVTVSNVCEGDLELYGVSLQDPNAPFDIGALGSVLVAANSSTDFTVTFDPMTSALFDTVALVESNDPDDQVVEVRLIGEGIAPVIDVDPETYDFGEPFIGCQNAQPYTISNVGNADLEVYDFSFASASIDFSFDENPGSNGDLPYTIAPANGVEVYLNYLPLDIFSDQAFLTVESNDPFTPEYLVTADGTGTFYGDHLDYFTQPLKAETDILFSADRSCSMSDDVALVLANFETFVNTLVGLDADFHLTMVVADDGCVVGSETYLDNTFSASAATEAFETMADMNFNLAPYGSNTERLHMVNEAALDVDNTGPGGCNEGFYRDKAYLSIVNVSDEPDQSINSWSYYVGLFQGMKADPDDVVMNAVAGDYPSGCGSAMAGSGYYEATVATGGLFLSICATDWASHLEELATESVSINDSFELTQTPVPQTIEVSVDGVNVTTGWEYDASINSVVFETDYIPAGGATIEIFYAKMPNCEG